MPQEIMSYEKFYEKLFNPIKEKYGNLDPETIAAIIGFSAGGPVSLYKIDSKQLYVTCELSQYSQQKLSSEGLNYELFSVGAFNEDWCRTVFTALGNLSFDTELGDKHTIDISGLVDDDSTSIVRLDLFSKTKIDGKNYGLYQVSAA